MKIRAAEHDGLPGDLGLKVSVAYESAVKRSCVNRTLAKKLVGNWPDASQNMRSHSCEG